MAAGGTCQAAGGTTHVQVRTSPDGKTWQATDLGPGGDQPNGTPAAAWPARWAATSGRTSVAIGGPASAKTGVGKSGGMASRLIARIHAGVPSAPGPEKSTQWITLPSQQT